MSYTGRRGRCRRRFSSSRTGQTDRDRLTQRARFSRTVRDSDHTAEESPLPEGRPQPDRVPTLRARPPPRSCSRAQRAARAFAGGWFREGYPALIELLSGHLRRSEQQSNLANLHSWTVASHHHHPHQHRHPDLSVQTFPLPLGFLEWENLTTVLAQFCNSNRFCPPRGRPNLPDRSLRSIA